MKRKQMSIRFDDDNLYNRVTEFADRYSLPLNKTVQTLLSYALDELQRKTKTR